MSKIIYEELAAFHPGYYVNEILDDMEINQSEFAKRLNTTDKTLSKLLAGKIDLSEDLAGKLSRVTGVSIGTWLSLQKKYEQKRYEIERKQKLKDEIEILKMIDCAYFIEMNILQKNMPDEKKIDILHNFLQVAELSILEQPDLMTACRTAIPKVDRQNVINANVWMQTGYNIARKVNCSPFDEAILRKELPYLRGLTNKKLAETYKEIRFILAKCGVAIVVLPYFKKSGLSGAVKWLNSEKVMLLLNDRGKDVANFWFTLFHELGHVMQKKKSYTYLTPKDKQSENILSLGRNNSDEEAKADDFARKVLIPQKKYDNFVNQNKCTFNVDIIKNFANEIGVPTSIVLRRLQHDEHVEWNKFNFLARSFKISV